MKYAWKTWSLYLLMAAFVSMPLERAKAQPAVSISLQTFYDALSPHGSWVQSPDYGYIWIPRVGPDFRPYYTNGRWAMTEYGNTWVSDYSWGWGPFHYGRWTMDPYYGWAWIPGTEWGPAWVSWRNGGGYYGWAPLGPSVQVHLHLGSYTPPALWWVFIPNRYLYNPRFHAHYRGPSYNTTIINQTTIINHIHVQNNHRYVTGPRRQDIERETGRKVAVYQVRQNQRPGPNQLNRNTVNLYKPDVVRPGNARPRDFTSAAPTKAGSSPLRSATAPNKAANTPRMAPNQAITTRNPNAVRQTTPPPSQSRAPEQASPKWTTPRPAVSNTPRTAAPARATQPKSYSSPQQRTSSPTKAPAINRSSQMRPSSPAARPSRSSNATVAPKRNAVSSPAMRSNSNPQNTGKRGR